MEQPRVVVKMDGPDFAWVAVGPDESCAWVGFVSRAHGKWHGTTMGEEGDESFGPFALRADAARAVAFASVSV